MATERHKLIDDLRRAMQRSEHSRNQLAIRTGIDPASLCRFAQRKGGLSLISAARLAEVLDLELTPRQPRAKGTER